MTATKSMSFVEAIKACYAKYFTFSGRARRSEFWWFYLFSSIVNWVVMGIIRHFHTAAAESFQGSITLDNFSAKYEEAQAMDSQFLVYYIIAMVILLVCCTIPLLAAHARRLHDIGKSGHLLWLILVCGVGYLIPLIMVIKDGDPQPNQYGESPKFKEE